MNRQLLLAFLTVLSFSAVLTGVRNYPGTVGAQSFDICITDDNGGGSLRFSSSTGEYAFCAGGRTYSGTGTITKVGRVIAIQDQGSDRRLIASVNTSAKSGSGSLQSPVGKTVGSISDRNTADSTCQCR